MSEVLLYGPIYNESSRDFINNVNAVDDSADLLVRVNTNGGDVLAGWGMVAKFNEYKGEKSVIIDGSAYSMGLFFAMYADNVEAYNFSTGLLHRAAYPDYYEENYMSEDQRERLVEMNKQLMAATKAAIDVEKFEELKGVTLKEVFSMDSRIDVMLTAKEMKQIGLISKVNKITPDKTAEINTMLVSAAAKYTPEIVGSNPKPTEKPEGQNSNLKTNIKMTISELQASNPELVSQIEANAVAAERDRAGAWLVNNDVDPVAVAAGIKSGENLSQTAMAEFGVKRQSMTQLAAVANESTTVETPEAPEAKSPAEELQARLNAEFLTSKS